jgi:hypothetical protein
MQRHLRVAAVQVHQRRALEPRGPHSVATARAADPRATRADLGLDLGAI